MYICQINFFLKEFSNTEIAECALYSIIISNLCSHLQRIKTFGKPYWGTPNGLPPPAVPVCGLQNELCPPNTKGTMFLIMLNKLTIFHYFLKRLFV